MTKRRSNATLKPASSKKSTPKAKYRSPLSGVLHRTAQGLYKSGTMSKKTMRQFDELCLTPIKPFTPREIEALRKREDASQAIFASYLGLSSNVISQWERGEKKPSGPSLKLLNLIEKNGLDHVA